MGARLLLRTHYQADEPALVSVLAREVLTPSRSTYRDTAAEHMSKAARRRGWKLNVPAAGYVVDLAASLSLATGNLVLTGRGWALSLIAGDHGVETFLPELNEAERVAFLTYFIAADGPAISLLARRLVEGSASRAELIDDRTVEKIFREVVSFYLEHTTDIRDRAELRNELQRLGADYKGRTPQHKIDVRLKLLARAGLAEEEGERYVPNPNGSMARLASLADDFESLERRLLRGEDLALASQILCGDSLRQEGGSLDARELVKAYKDMAGTFSDFVEVDALADYLTIRRLASGRGFLGREAVRDELRRWSRASPRAVRFHVDRVGRPAFVAVSGELLGVEA